MSPALSDSPRQMTLGALIASMGAGASAGAGPTVDIANEVACDVADWRDLVVTGLSLDTRALEPGDLYLALPGRASHGMDHADAAAAAGAVAIVTVPDVPAASEPSLELNVPVIKVGGLARQINQLADTFFSSPADDVRLVAVTGTDGKTSVSRFVADAVAIGGELAGYIGTIGWGLAGEHHALHASTLTTPDAVALRRMLRALVDQGAGVVTLEASSHGIAEGRLDGLSIDIAVLTNLGRDHLDYHGSMEAYRAAKARLFDWPSLSGVVINADDTLGQALVARHMSRDDFQVSSFSLVDDSMGNAVIAVPGSTQASDHFVARGIHASATGLAFSLHDGSEILDVHSGLIGRFNVANLLACHGVLRLLGYDAARSATVLSSLSSVPGRMELLSIQAGQSANTLSASELKAETADQVTGRPAVIVDYAHTPGALVAALGAARAHCSGTLFVVFGCGGDRDPGKRAPMAQAAEAADRIILTDDNPRTEDAVRIRDMVLAGFKDKGSVVVVADRRKAIQRAIAEADVSDVVLIAGKGHEDYQIIGDTRLPFSDREVAEAALLARATERAPKEGAQAPKGAPAPHRAKAPGGAKA